MVAVYDCIATQVRARRARQGEIVECSGVGPVLTHAGQWIVEIPEAGTKLVMDHDAFDALFRQSDHE
jgi:hypothetical protein